MSLNAQVLSPEALQNQLSDLGSGKFLADPYESLRKGIGRFKPAQKIRTVDWAEENRKFKLPDSGTIVRYDRWRTPYNIAIMDALDDPSVELVVNVKPSRSGGTAVCENYLAKLIDVGPFPRTAWILGSDKAVKEYVEGVIKDLFELHPRLQARVGTGRSENTDKMKKISGQLLEFLAANDGTFRNREFGFGMMDEPDGWTKFGESPKIQLEGRQKNLGRRRKGAIVSHPDKGWASGVAAAWEQTSRGIFVLRCSACSSFAASHAPKQWDGVPQFRLYYEKQSKNAKKTLSDDERIALAERTAGLKCPHCGEVHDDDARDAMVVEAGRNGWWMHRGQTLDPEQGILGQPKPHTARGFWVHGTVLKTSPLAQLAKSLEEALIKFERSGGSRTTTKRLREFHSKQLGEVFAGKSAIAGLSASKLRQRAKRADVRTTTLFPANALFLVAAVDVQADRFDVSFRAFDQVARSWWIDRLVLRQRRGDDGIFRDIRTRERVEDWQAIIEEVVLRRFPIEGREDSVMPVAAVAVDIGDGNVTKIGREFARQSIVAGHTWGGWSKIRLIRGSRSAAAVEVAEPRMIDRDDNGAKIEPGVPETTLGVHRLKELTLERLAIEDGGPGQCYFNPDISATFFEELFNEPLIDGRFERQGPNESFDLFGYEEAVRQMLQPDRKDVVWHDERLRPIWARPISRSRATETPHPTEKRSILAQFDELNED